MSSLTIGKKLFLGVGTLVVLTFALGITALFSISSIGSRLLNIVDVTVKKQTLTHELDTYSSDMLADTRGVLVRSYMKDQATAETYNQQFVATREAMQANLDVIRPMLVRPAGRQAVEDVQETLSILGDAEQKIMQSVASGDMDSASSSYSAVMLPTLKRQKADTLLMLKIQDELVAADGSGAKVSIATSRWSSALLLGLSCLVGIAVIFVVRQINQLLRNGVRELAESAVQIASAAGQVSASSQSLAQGASEQTATIEETSSASTEIKSMAQRNTENSRAAAEAVTNSGVGFGKTNQSLTEMVVAMDGISASSKKISKIIKVIDEISFQTNILALNAAVEAARAGEAGMGFAVVADEVRNLAQRCAQAAKDTADLIEESIQRSDGGRIKVAQVVASIQTIAAEASKCKVLVDEINIGSVEQSNGIEQISRAITQMEQVTQSSAAIAEQSAAAAEELSAQAERMKEIVEGLRAMVDGGNKTRRNPNSPTSAQAASGNAHWARLEA